MSSQDYYLLKALTGWREAEIAEPVLPEPPAGSIQSLEQILDHLDGIRTVTLDVFDTLLRRDVDPPDHPKQAAMQQLRFALQRHGVALTVSELLQLRHDAEAQARQDALRHGGDSECSLSEIFYQLYRDIGTKHGVALDDSLPVADLVDFEVQVEIARLSPMPGAAELLRTLRERGTRILLLSDMYLEDAPLRRILEHHGLLDLVDDIHVSSHTRLSKGSGSIFRHLAETGDIIPAATLHVGDHTVSDLQRPREQGLQALLYHNPDEKRRRARLAQAARLGETFGDSAAMRQACGMPAGDAAQHTARDIAYQRLGPVFTLFALDLLREALASDFRQVYFLARDGHLLQRLYERLRAGLDISRLLPTPDGRYLYLSRASTRLAELGDSPEQLSSLAQRVNRQAGVWALVDILGLDREAYRPLVEQILAGEDPDSTLDESGRLQQQLLAAPDFMARLQADIADGRQRLADYLEQQGVFDAGRVMMVDIGWNGSILATLEKAFGDVAGFPAIRGRFFGRLYGSPMQQLDIAPGFAYDARRNNPVEHLVNECRELFESVSSSFEGSVLGYQDKDGQLLPHCAANTLGEAERTQLEALQQGVLDYCDDFIELYNRFSPTPEALQADAVLQAVSLVAGTRPDEQACLAELQFDLSWGTEGRVSLREYLGIGGTAQTPPVQSSAPLQVSLERATDGHDAQQLFEHLHQLVERLKQEDSLVFYGVGTVASLIAPLLIDRIRYFVDGNAALHGQTFLGVPILPPETVLEQPEHSLFVTPINRKNVLMKRLAGCRQPVFYIDDFI